MRSLFDAIRGWTRRRRAGQPRAGAHAGLTCRELVELVTDYLENALSPAERARFEDHIGMCSGCHNYLEQMRMTIATTGHLAEETIPEDAKAELLHVFRDWKGG